MFSYFPYYLYYILKSSRAISAFLLFSITLRLPLNIPYCVCYTYRNLKGRAVKVVCFLSCFLYFSVFASQDFFVQVTSVKTKDNASYMIKRLKDYGFSSHSKKENNLHKVLVGPFKTRKQADEAVKLIIKKISQAQPHPKKVIPISIKKKKKGKSSKKTAIAKPPKQKKEKSINYHKAFIGVNFGGAYVNINNSKSTTTLASEPDKDGLSYELEAGYYLTSNLYATLNYQRVQLTDVDFDNGFSSFNYRFDKLHDIYPYIGLIAGYSRMQWNEDPITALSSDEESFSFIGGAQLGAEMFMFQDISLYMYYRYLIMDHLTKIKVLSQTQEFSHDSLQNFNFGLRYNF